MEGEGKKRKREKRKTKKQKKVNEGPIGCTGCVLKYFVLEVSFIPLPGRGCFHRAFGV